MEENEILNISPSALDVFISCPRKYHYRYTAKIAEPELEEKSSLIWLNTAEKGTMIHRAMELYVINVILPLSGKLDTSEAPHGSNEEKEIVTALDNLTFEENDFQAAWEQAVKETEESLSEMNFEAQIIPVSAKERELAEAEQICKSAIEYMLEQMKMRKQYPVKVEMKFGKRGNEDEGETLIIKRDGEEDFAICGSIDRVDYDVNNGKYIVIDYKTGKIDNKLKLRKGNRDDLIQDMVYAVAFEAMNQGKEVFESRYIFPASDNQEIYESITDERKEEFLDRLWGIIRSIRNKGDEACMNNIEKYPDNEYTCKYCAYAELCMAYSDLKKAEE